MVGSQNLIDRVGHLVHKRFLVLLIGAYGFAAIWPWLGTLIKGIILSHFSLAGETVSVSIPMLLLACLLFNAGLGADARQLAEIARNPFLVLTGLALNLLVPVVFLLLAYPLLWFWHDPEETQNLLLGLAIVAAMPIAGSSTAWAQNANGNVALSLGLVILSTLFSPLTTPLVLGVCRSMASGAYAEVLDRLSGQGTGTFLLACVVIPSLAGLALRQMVGGALIREIKPALKVFNSLVLLFLCYINASTALPQMIAKPDWDFIAMIGTVVTALCVSTFTAGWLLARSLKVESGQQMSLMFGLGMNNNGTGMVLACASLSAIPAAVLPVLAYNLMQHLVASGVNRMFNDVGNA